MFSSNPVPVIELTIADGHLLLSCHLLLFLSVCRARHYIHIPVHFRPKSVGKFEGLLVIQTDEGKSVAIRLIAEALEKN